MQKSKSALFLMELIIVIFFFALTSAVCLQVFVKAHDTAYATKSLNNATLWANNACECFYEYGSDPDTIKQTLDSAFNLDGYSYSLSFSSDDSFEYMTFDFTDVVNGTSIYSYTFKQHIKEVAGNE